MNRSIRCIALSTSYGNCSGIAWTFFTHYDGVESPRAALRLLATELVARYRDRSQSLDPAGCTVFPGRVDATRFVAFVNHLLRGH